MENLQNTNGVKREQMLPLPSPATMRSHLLQRPLGPSMADDPFLRPTGASSQLPSSGPFYLDRDKATKRAPRACERCKQRKTKCTGEAVCRKCMLSNVECVYKEKDARVSVKQSKLQDMKDRINALEEELAAYRAKEESPREVRSVDELFPSEVKRRRSSLLNLQTKKDFLESGSSDMVIMKLTAMQERSRGLSPKQDDAKAPEAVVEIQHSSVEDMNIPIEEANRLTDICHFFLNTVYLPFELSVIRAKLKEFYADGALRFPKTKENRFWKSLVLILFALGYHYSGSDESPSVSERLVQAAFEDFFPLTEMDPQAAVVALVASMYFRAVSRDADAMFYSNLSIEICAILGMHKPDNPEMYSERDIEHRSRVFWVGFGINRFLGAKMGHPLLLNNKEVDREYPEMIDFTNDQPTLFPSAVDFQFVVELARIAEDIGNVIYKEREETYNDDTDSKFLSSIADLIQRLINWNEFSPQSLRINLNEKVIGDGKDKRLRCSIHLNYCYCIHLSTIPILYRLLEKKENEKIAVDELPSNISTMLSICLNAAQLTINILATCFNEKMLALFGVMDLDYVFSSALTCFMAMVLGVDAQLYSFESCLHTCFNILHEMSRRGNKSAELKLSKLESLIRGYEFSNSKLLRGEPSVEPESVASTPKVTMELDSVISMPAQVVDTSFLPSATEDKLDFLKDTDLEFWENAYKSAHAASGWDGFEKYMIP